MKKLTLEQEIELLKKTRKAYNFAKSLRNKGLEFANALENYYKMLDKCLIIDSEINDIVSLRKVLKSKQEKLRVEKNGMAQLKILITIPKREALQKLLKARKETAVGVLNDFIDSLLK